MNRGARRQTVFHEEGDCLQFFSLLEAASERYRIEWHGYCLMPNHYHLLARSIEGRLSSAMAFLGSRFTRRLNDRYGWDGAVFRGRFRNRLVEDEEHLRTTLAYIHLNPVDARLTNRPDRDCWTSHRAYVGLDERPPWLRCDLMLSKFGDEHVLEGQMRELQEGSVEWPPDYPVEVERLWKLLGTPEVLGRLDRRASAPSSRTTLSPGAVLDAVASTTGATLDQLMEVKRGPRANPARRFAVWAVARETALTHRQIGNLLGMSTNQVNLVLSRLGRTRPTRQLLEWMSQWVLESSDRRVAEQPQSAMGASDK